ncbi:MAG: adenylate/guanylate cyclase domain-containing protein [Alphaproteobacteria bacterium]|nr:adenylate/guanylate cyclase domain-containing protein [Alphaproteobacteria bacterium]
MAAIVAADVVGYSRLIGCDEEGTLDALRRHRREVIDPLIEEHEGRIANTAGDSLLLEFPSAVEAVRCAIAVQEVVGARNREVESNRQIRFRIGVNVGDVVAEDGDLLGDGVNVAARLEGLADPGGICLSDDCYRQVTGKTGAVFEDAGTFEVKNIARPLQVWRWQGAKSTSHRVPEDTGSRALRDKPSIAVLPFANLSGDPEQEYFSDGITEDIITALSRIRQLFVMARNTSFTYKGQAVDVRTAARELGVRYVLEGSVRRAGSRVRITAQLIDGESGNHLWAERYDRDLEDIFTVQDAITEVVSGTLEPEITKAEFERQRHAPPESLDAWQLFQRGVYHFHRLTPEDDAAARQFLEAAIAQDPSFSPSYAMLARCLTRNANSELSEDVDSTYSAALMAARTAVSLDREDAHAHAALGFASRRSDLAASLRAFEDALSLNPNLASAHFGLSTSLLDAGRTDEAAEHVTIAMRLSPRDPLMPLYRAMLGTIRFALGDDENALALLPSVAQGKVPGTRRAALRVAALALLGRQDEMRAERTRLLSAYPHLTISLALLYNSDVGERLADGLRKAGLPE